MGITVDGNDVEAVADVAAKGIQQCRADKGPVFIEAITYRTRGHYGGDPEHTYRTKEEVESWKQKCPVLRFRNKLRDQGISENILGEIDRDVQRQLTADQQWALEQRFPTLEEATSHVMIPLGQEVKKCQ